MNLCLDLQEIGINVDFLFFDRFLYAKWLNKIPDLKAYGKETMPWVEKKIKSENFAESSKSWKENKIILLLKLFFSKGLISEI